MNETAPPAGSFFAPLIKRWWLILGVGIVAAGGTYFYYKGKTPLYLATARLYLAASAEQNSTGTGAAKTAISGRALADQVELINSPLIGTPVRRALRSEGDIAAARGKAKAVGSPTSDFITITTEAHSPKAAVKLGNAYAAAYVARQHADFARAIRAQIANVREQLARIETSEAKAAAGKGAAASASATIQTATLSSKINALETQLASGAGAEQVGSAKANPLPLSPTPKKSAIFGGLLGMLLAAIAVYALSRGARRISSLAEIEEVFGQSVITALPKVRNPVVRRDGVATVSRPLVEPLRRLHTTLQLTGAHEGSGRSPRTLLFLSPEAGEGKSSVIANLARVQRDAGARVAVVEANFRRPVLSRLLDVQGPGLADVLAGTTTPEQVARLQQGAVVADHLEPGAGSLTTLAGGAAANPPALLAPERIGPVLRTLGEEHDFVLVDTPPLLEFSDAMPLLAQVDAILIVARIGHTRNAPAQRLMQMLARTASAPVLGVVANCAARKDAERFGFSYAPAPGGLQPKLIGR